MMLVHVQDFGDTALAYISPNIWLVIDNFRPEPSLGLPTRYFCATCSQQIRDMAMMYNHKPIGDHSLWCRCIVIGYRPAWVSQADLLKNWAGFIDMNNQIAPKFPRLVN